MVYTSAWYIVYGIWYIALYMVYGVWCMVYCVWYMVYTSVWYMHGIWYIVYGIWYMVYGILCIVYGIWHMVCGVWCVVYGIWYIVYGIWCILVYGILCMVYGILCMVYGIGIWYITLMGLLHISLWGTYYKFKLLNLLVNRKVRLRLFVGSRPFWFNTKQFPSVMLFSLPSSCYLYNNGTTLCLEKLFGVNMFLCFDRSLFPSMK